MTTQADHRVFTIDPADPLADLRIQEALTAYRLIAVTWCIEDVRGLHPGLDDDQCWEVLQEAKDKHDADWGITWTTLQTVADELFPRDDSAPAADEAEEARP
jgi:hypothetical protein